LVHESVVDGYLLLGLRLGRLVDGFVDCWFGDPALATQVAAEPAPNPADLAADADRLLAALPDTGLEPARQRYLAAQLTALRCSARRLAGVATPFLTELEAYFDVTVDAGDPDRFDTIHDQIGEILPGPGDLRARVAAYHERDRVPRDRLGEALQAVSRALRDLTREQFGLPDGEEVVYEVVEDRPWNAFNRYHGDLRSVVTINADVAHGMSSLPRLATHEVYPGHHTEHCLKETGLVRERGQAEQTIMPVNTPQCLVSEGVGELGMHALLGPGWGTWTQDVLDGLGLTFHGALAEQLQPLLARLQGARLDALVLLHDRSADPDDVTAYLQHRMLVDEQRARQMMRFLMDPLWRAYTVTLVEGTRLVRDWLDARPPTQSVADRFQLLLREQFLPADLR
jgi:hypothetical protein